MGHKKEDRHNNKNARINWVLWGLDDRSSTSSLIVGLSPEQLVSFFIIAEASDVDLQAISLPPIGIPRTLCTISGVNLKEKPFDKVTVLEEQSKFDASQDTSAFGVNEHFNSKRLPNPTSETISLSSGFRLLITDSNKEVEWRVE